MKSRHLILLGALASGAALAFPTAALAEEKAKAALASENWENHCAKCHGPDGKGQTKVGKKLNLKDYTSAKVQTELKDPQIEKAISEGVFENGKEKMKAYKDELSPAEINDLVAYIRHLKP